MMGVRCKQILVALHQMNYKVPTKPGGITRGSCYECFSNWTASHYLTGKTVIEMLTYSIRLILISNEINSFDHRHLCFSAPAGAASLLHHVGDPRALHRENRDSNKITCYRCKFILLFHHYLEKDNSNDNQQNPGFRRVFNSKSEIAPLQCWVLEHHYNGCHDRHQCKWNLQRSKFPFLHSSAHH
jgi:hypothetical protein